MAGTTTDLCLGKVCNQPPTDDCQSPKQFKSYDTIGSCSEGVCSYASHLIACSCEAHVCTTDPCADVTCDSPPTAKCKDINTQTKYAASGTCSAGSCSYAPADVPCGANKLCGGAAICSVCKSASSCGDTCTACGGNTTKCQDLGTSSKCVQCLADADCSGDKPVCDTKAGSCVARPSCVGLSETCGITNPKDCCASSLIPGSTFFRSYDGATYIDSNYPATVSDFRLDNYEITVGRFRKFVAAYSQTMIPAGAGKNPNNPADKGWDTAWNAQLDATPLALTESLKCDSVGQSWTDVPGTVAAESRPIGCLDWYQAEAFCIWDGGRLPTEAEWNYAAAGGTEQRIYPWGSGGPGPKRATYGVTKSLPVASTSPGGDGKWGQADMAGNAYEWVQDIYLNTYSTPCSNCSIAAGSTLHVLRGGGFNEDATFLFSSFRSNSSPYFHIADLGARCARKP